MRLHQQSIIVHISAPKKIKSLSSRYGDDAPRHLLESRLYTLASRLHPLACQQAQLSIRPQATTPTANG
jgi:hypothetical protein